MSQERTEQRDPVADLGLVEAIEKRAAHIRHRIEHNPRIKDTFGAIIMTNKMLGELELASALRHWIEKDEQRRKEAPKSAPEAVRRIMDAQGEIDRLNAENTGLEKAVLAHMNYIRVIEPAKESWRKQALEYRAEVRRLESKSLDLTAKVQDRDAEIIRQRERADRLDSELHKQNCRNQDQAEEIGRLRSALEAARQNVSHIFNASDDASYIEKYALVTIGLIDSATGGAE